MVSLTDLVYDIVGIAALLLILGSFLRIWSHLQKKYLMENFIFCTVEVKQVEKVPSAIEEKQPIWLRSLQKIPMYIMRGVLQRKLEAFLRYMDLLILASQHCMHHYDYGPSPNLASNIKRINQLLSPSKTVDFLMISGQLEVNSFKLTLYYKRNLQTVLKGNAQFIFLCNPPKSSVNVCLMKNY